MKIKRLQISNIASIEKADIDFENDLRSSVDNQPTSLFLITGDTGAGKTVILDCISMALFGITPRVKNVANKSNNFFISPEGNEVKISDISQYRRLGIGMKEESFSRLLFEGNDGVEYEATFSLKVSKTGKFRSPAWSLRIGSKELIEGNKKEEIKATIENAIGLNYDQFCRMAMLAQGQFATFLTGAKEEREKILEQLTSTGHFSRYGEAIERIYKREDKKLKDLQLLLSSETGHLLTDEELDTAKTEIKQYQDSANLLRKEISLIQSIATLVEDLSKYEKESEECKKNYENLLSIAHSSDHKEKRNLLSQWDATTTERNLLKSKWEAETSVSSGKKRLIRLAEIFSIYKSDLSARKSLSAEKNKVLSQKKTILKGKEPFRNVFENATAIIENIYLLRENIKELGIEEKKLDAATKESPELKKKKEEADRKAEVASAHLKGLREKIDGKYREKEKLNPTETTSLLNAAHLTRSILSDIQNALEEQKTIRTEIETNKTTLDTLYTQQCDAQRNLKQLKENSASLRAELDDAKQRFDTMHLSVSENFNRLRHRLYKEKACRCPLCGEKKDWSDVSNSDQIDFDIILSPLQKEVDDLSSRWRKAEEEYLDGIKEETGITEKYNSCKKEQSNLSIKLVSSSETLATLYRRIAENSDNKFVSGEYSDADIRATIEKNEADISNLSLITSKIGEIQDEIDKLIKIRQPIELEAEDLERNRNNCRSALELNLNRIELLKKGIANLKSKNLSLELKIDLSLKNYISDWKENKNLVESIKDDTESFISLEREIENLSGEIEKDEALHTRLLNICKEIETSFEKISFTTADIHKTDALHEKEENNLDEDLSEIKTNISSYNDEQLSRRWTLIYGEITSECGNILKSESAISDLTKTLNEYYDEVKSSEEKLADLIGKEMIVPAIRKEMEDFSNTFASVKTSLEKARANARTTLSSLLSLSGIDKRELLPSVEELNERKKEKEGALENVLIRLGSASDRIMQHEKNINRVKEIKVLIEASESRYRKWEQLNRYFGGTKFRTLVQSHILRPLLRNANLYLSRITDHFTLTCSEQNEQLSILVLDRYNKNQVRSATVLSGGERFMISLALSLALSAMNKAGMNVDILFIDEGFGTLDAHSLNAVMDTLRRLPEIAGQNGRRVGVISHREELAERIDVQIMVKKCGEGRSRVEILT